MTDTAQAFDRLLDPGSVAVTLAVERAFGAAVRRAAEHMVFGEDAEAAEREVEA